MKSKEQWIERIMESLDGAGPARLSPDAMESILKRMQDPGSRTDSVKLSLVFKIAAVILLLISLNVFTIVHYSSSSGSSKVISKSIASEYFSYMDHYNL
ncbi:MAG: hypothetical protein NTY96_08730 [Bacteroidetes bacterium]|nr:hypothetical protein [Bacteroidota bacterium]